MTSNLRIVDKVITLVHCINKLLKAARLTVSTVVTIVCSLLFYEGFVDLWE